MKVPRFSHPVWDLARFQGSLRLKGLTRRDLPARYERLTLRFEVGDDTLQGPLGRSRRLHELAADHEAPVALGRRQLLRRDDFQVEP